MVTRMQGRASSHARAAGICSGRSDLAGCPSSASPTRPPRVTRKHNRNAKRPSVPRFRSSAAALAFLAGLAQRPARVGLGRRSKPAGERRRSGHDHQTGSTYVRICRERHRPQWPPRRRRRASQQTLPARAARRQSSRRARQCTWKTRSGQNYSRSLRAIVGLWFASVSVAPMPHARDRFS